MPVKNSIKVYINNGIYHIFNRGVDKRDIFLDENDYRAFLQMLAGYFDTRRDYKYKPQKLCFKNDIEIIAYCLMPNHFHLLIKQKEEKSIAAFMQSLIAKYVMYFNKRYERSGTLFQGRYKGILILKDAYLLHLSRYIHINPIKIGRDPEEYLYSSYKDYTGDRKTKWIKTDTVAQYFNVRDSSDTKLSDVYRNFVQDAGKDLRELPEELTLE